MKISQLFYPLCAIVMMGGIVASCTDARRARTAATWSDKPANVTCYSYAAGGPLYQGRSSGKVTYDDGGRVSFVDAATGRYTTVEGECLIVYAK